METPPGNSLSALIAKLRDRPESFDFFGAVRGLNARLPGQFPSIGTAIRPADEPVRFAQRPMMNLPLTRLLDVEESRHREVEGFEVTAKVWISFFGLFGTNGPLPYHLTSLATYDRSAPTNDRRTEASTNRPRDGVKLKGTENSLSAFCNVFHHRLITLYYRAWAANQKAVALDEWARRVGPAGPSASAPRGLACFADLTGIPDEELSDRTTPHGRLRSLPTLQQFYFAGWLASPVRSAEGLQTILATYFGLPVEVQEHRGSWVNLPDDARCIFAPGRQNLLGMNTILGANVWDVQLSFRLKVGPLDWDDFTSLLPGSSKFDRLQDWVETYCAYEYFWDVQLVLKRDQVPEMKLGGTSALGWTTWMRSPEKKAAADAADVILEPEIFRGRRRS
ncbi:MAG: type VI secretion system baseplate subunit TssG [Verrucomicrobiales bacterium]|nr:type VI secretion system baseplate subunit TssG [Verrucomicrobiales bacterium]